MYKWSKFNYYVSNNHKTIIKNSLTKAVIELPNEYLETLTSENFYCEDKNELVKLGILSSEIKELRELQDSIKNVVENPSNCVVVLAPTMACNLHCSYCYELGIHNNFNLSISQLNEYFYKISNIIEERSIKHLELILFGGEPIISNEKILNHLSSLLNSLNCEHAIQIITNGYQITEKKFAWMNENNISSIQITLDGMKEYHDRYRKTVGNKGTFDKIINNMKRIIDDDLCDKLIVRINCSKENINSAKELINFIATIFKYSKEKFQFSFGQLGFGYSESANSFIKNLGDSDENFWEEFSELFLILKEHEFELLDYYAVGDMCTYKRSNSIVISPDGLYKCMRVIGRKEDITDITDIKKSNSKFSMYNKCVNKECKYIPYCHLECRFKVGFEKERVNCRIKELDYINKSILRKLYL